MDLAASENVDFIGPTNSIPDDLPPHVHIRLDTSVQSLSELPFETQAAVILSVVMHESVLAYSNTDWPIDFPSVNLASCKNLLGSNSEIQHLLMEAHSSSQYSKIRR
jgi:hypothetical protein